jgi:hypothetical protein
VITPRREELAVPGEPYEADDTSARGKKVNIEKQPDKTPSPIMRQILELGGDVGKPESAL